MNFKVEVVFKLSSISAPNKIVPSALFFYFEPFLKTDSSWPTPDENLEDLEISVNL